MSPIIYEWNLVSIVEANAIFLSVQGKKKKNSCTIFISSYSWLYFIFIVFDNVRFSVSCWLVICLWFWFLHISLQRAGWFSSYNENGRLVQTILHELPSFLCFLLTVKTISVICHSSNLRCLFPVSSRCALQRHLKLDYLVWKTKKRGLRNIRQLSPHVLLLNTGKCIVWM